MGEILAIVIASIAAATPITGGLLAVYLRIQKIELTTDQLRLADIESKKTDEALRLELHETRKEVIGLSNTVALLAYRVNSESQ
ncbi:hypothetical protein [Sphaerothrix gracilis]|uniref:hypothetical protein n=1 Tax=Sphaerothrix gracilis TaxID=3151835 RepID=UPI0031FCDC6B